MSIKPWLFVGIGLHACVPSSLFAVPAHMEEIEELIVTASPLSTDPDQSTGIVGKLNREEITRQGSSSLAEALSNVPGVSGSGFASGASRPVIRGFNANRVRVLENGVGSMDVSDLGPDHGVPIDPLSTQSLEVVRGAATLRYGNQAIGGVVNAINNRVPLSLPEQALTGELTGSYADNADTLQGSALLDAKLNQFAVHADAFTRDANDYDIPDGRLRNSYFDGNGYALGTSYFFHDHESRVGAAVTQFDSEYGIPGEENYIDLQQDKALFGSSLTIGGELLQMITIDAGQADYEHSEIDPVTGEKHATFKDDEWDLRGEAILGGIGPFSSAALGVQLQNRDFSALGEAVEYLRPTNTDTFATFGFAEDRLSDNMLLQLGARVEQIKVEGTPLSDVKTKLDFTPVSGSIGLLLDSSDNLKLGLNLSSTARAPAQTELFARGPHDGPATYETGDPSLKIERANSVEATLRLRRDILHFDGALWYTSFNNFIYGHLTGNSCDESGNCVAGGGEELKEMFYRQRDASFRGLEVKTTLTLLNTGKGTLTAQALGDYVRAIFNNNDNIPRIPPYHIGAGLSWDSETFDAGFTLKYSAKQKHASTSEFATEDFTSLNAYISWKPLPTNPNIGLSLIGSNLTDSEQRNAVALNKDEVELPGRDMRLVLHVDF